MRLLVCGGRDWNRVGDSHRMLNALHEFKPITLLIAGGAIGADSIAEIWAKERRIDRLIVPADWKKHGKRAGPIRNADMITRGEPQMVLAFPGGRGTADMVAKAKAAGIPVIDYIEPAP